MSSFNDVMKKICVISLAACMFTGVGAATAGSYIFDGISVNAAGSIV